MANTRTTQVVTAPTQAYAQADRRRVLADALQKRALAPRDMSAMQGSDPYLLGLTQLGEALMARYANKGASQAEGAADAQMRDVNSAAIEKLAGPYQIESIDPGGEGTPLAGGSLPGSKIQDALAGTDPRQANQVVAKALLEKAMPAATEPYTLGEGQSRYVGSTRIATNPKAAPDKPTGTWKVYSQPLPDGKVQDYSYNDATNEWVPKGVPYKPIDKTPNVILGGAGGEKPRWVQAQDPTDPTRTIWINLNDQRSGGPPTGRETDMGKRENDLQFSMRGADSIMQEAEDLLTGTVRDPTGKVDPTKKGDIPTGSLLGEGVDAVAGFVGATPSGAQEADRLKAVGGWLSTKVPRFQGPQSDKDTALYKEMAAQLGDASIPVARRLAALQTVRGIIATYQKQGQDVWGEQKAPAAPAAAKTVVRRGKLNGRNVVQYSDGTTDYAD